MQCLCATTRLAARAITRAYEEELRPVGLQAPQFALLAELSQRGPISQAGLMKGLAMDQTTLSRNLAVMVRRGWLKNEPRGRLRLYSMTRSGRRMLDRAMPAWKRAQDKMKEALGADWEVIRSALGRLVVAVESLREEEES